MPDDDIVIDDSTPVFESIESLHTRKVMSSPSQDDVEIDDEDVSTATQSEVRVHRGRGRPKGSKNRTKGSLPYDPQLSTGVSGRLAKDVSLRTQQVLKGASSVPAIWRPYYQMHDIEAQNIADPLASYATRQAEISPIVERLINDFDLVAAAIGAIAYGVRVYKENQDYINAEREQQADRRPSRTRQEPMVNNRTAVNQNQQTIRPEPPAENSYADTESVPEYPQDVPPISVPYIGQL